MLASVSCFIQSVVLMINTHVHLTRVSSNSKTGPIPVSTTESTTCPDSCPLKYKRDSMHRILTDSQGKPKQGPCYAKNGPTEVHWRAVTNKLRGGSWAMFCELIKSLPKGQIWRHNQAGDLPGFNEQVDTKALTQLVDANRGRKGYTYTHKYNLPENLVAIKKANEKGFTINLSANSLEHADRLSALNVAPVAVLLPSTVSGNVTKTLTTPQGRKVIVCPSTYRDNTTCLSCGLCAVAKIGSCYRAIIGFPAHGTQHKLVTQIASN